ncbi:MAG: cobalamin B12-binding domain-containing protein [Atribacterota bacterium]|nr:cobalamin B12-binding domain-containing protein [Atribacterota bacterium]
MPNPPIILISLHDEYATGVRSIASYLESHNYTVHMVFLKRYVTIPRETTSKELRLLVDYIKKVNPWYVGLSVRTFYVSLAAKITELIHAECPGTKVIWGNVHATIDPEDAIKYAELKRAK